jgi:hypothetical protein
MPDRFLIGRRTFFDFGPPFEFFEIISVRTTGGGTLVERIQVTPPGLSWIQPATVEVVAKPFEASVPELLGKTNPCSIPEKELRRELKRCNRCPVYSGADVAMEVECGGQRRRIRMGILDRDMFDPRPVTPQRTSWTMALLDRLDRALGSAIMERSAFGALETPSPSPKPQSNPLLEDLASGKFDALFDRSDDKPSELFRKALNPPPAPPPPTVELTGTSPFRPSSFALPKYPPLAAMANISGTVSFTIAVQPDGHVGNLRIVAGHPLLKVQIEPSMKDWIFPSEAAGQDVQVTIEFKLTGQR